LSLYRLTPDFALKLLVLHGRAKANMNVILCGHTGVGKSELLRLYSVVINSASQLVPDLIFEMTIILEEMLYKTGTRTALHPRFEEFIRKVKIHLLSFLKPSSFFIHLCLRLFFPPKLFDIKRTNVMMEGSGILETAIAEMEAIVRTAGELKREQQQEGEEVQTFLPHCRDFLVNRIQTLLQKYPLVERTNLLARVAATTLQGEVVIEDLEELIRLVTEVLSAKFSDLFHPILMHQKITPEDFRDHICTIKKKFTSLQARSAIVNQNQGLFLFLLVTFLILLLLLLLLLLLSSSRNSIFLSSPFLLTDDAPQLRIVAFVDEANATAIMGMLQEVLCDNSLDGEPLPTDIMWVAAINRPQLKSIQNGVAKPLEEEDIEDAFSDYTGLRPTGLSKQTYAVRPLAPSLEHLVIDFDELSENQEETFLQLLLQYRTRFQNDQEREDLLHFVMKGQTFIREAAILNVRVSIRDIMRSVELYHFFRFTRPGQLLMNPERLGK
jgi:energy-coupling factor transporter ATP-binding protein EcfA2